LPIEKVARISVSYILLCGQVILLLTVLLLQCLATAAFSEQPQDNVTSYHIIPVECVSYTELYEYRPPSPVVFCSHLLEEFIPCQDPVDHAQNSTAILEMGHGCTQRCESHTSHLHDIECAGPREFLRGNEPCIKYAGHYFITTLLYSFFLGCFGVDRFCTQEAWASGGLMPSDNSNWCTFY
uniref:TM2 domain containing 2 n=1 Tax=Oncorhynchus mykiss TaxID=8022 RepID=A0A8C7QYI2_ONCMY